MNVEYRTEKDLPCNELYQLFLAVGWATEDKTTQSMIDNFNVGFLNSTFVFSAWIDGRLVGCIRALSDLYCFLIKRPSDPASAGDARNGLFC